MKNLFCVLVTAALASDVWSAWGQPTPVYPASQTEVNAGKIHTKFVAPDTLAGLIGTNEPSLFPIGTNDSTILLQNAMVPNAAVKLQPGDYYITNTINLTNGVYLVGYGATIHFATNITGFALYEPTNVWNCTLDGLSIEGGYSNVVWNVRGTGVTNLAAGILPNVTANAPFVDHSGLFINAGGGGLVRNLTIYNFPGHSYFMTDTNDQTSYRVQQTVYVNNCAHNNYLGPWPQAWSFDNGRGTLSPAYQADAEYIILNGWNCFSNTIGMIASAGSAIVSKNNLNGNYIGLLVTSGVNTAKGLISGNTINHNNYAGMIIQSGTSGEIIFGNTVLANPQEIFWADAGMEIWGNKFSNENIIFSNSATGGPNYFHDNSYQGVFGTDFIIKGLVVNTNQAWGNYSTTIPGDTDGQPGIFLNGAGVTNSFQNTITYTNFLIGTVFTNTSTRSILVSGNARVNPTTTLNAKLGLAVSPTGAGNAFTTNVVVGMEADVIFTTGPHEWAHAVGLVPSGGLYKFVDITGEGVITMTNSFYQTIQ